MNRLQVRRTNEIGGEDLHNVGPGIPRRHNLCRGERPGHHQFVVAVAQSNHIDIHRRGDNELGPRQDRRPGGLGVEHRPRSQQHLVAQGFADRRENVEHPRHSEGHFQHIDPTRMQRLGHLDQLLAGVRTDDRHDATVQHAGQVGMTAHGAEVQAKESEEVTEPHRFR